MILDTDDQKRLEQDAALCKQLHGTSVSAQGLFAMRKDFKTHKVVLDSYFKYFGKDIAEDDKMCTGDRRQEEYSTMVKLFYNLATDFYEYGWCKSLHFCRFSYDEPFLQAIARHEHYLAHQVGIKEDMMVLDVGCGLGGPAREIAKFTDATITGLNNSEYQIQKATHYTKQAGLSQKVSFVKGNFVEMDFKDNTFDAAYAIEATLHAPTLDAVYSEIFRVLKPGAVFGVYEWLLTDRFDENNSEHRGISLGIQQGNGIAKLFTVSQGLSAVRRAGFELIHHEDLAHRPAVAPWYHPLSFSIRDVRSLSDIVTYAPMSSLGRTVTHYMTRALELARILPRGTQAVADSLSLAGDSLVEGGQKDLFTPMYFLLARKPTE
ncbi:sterol methyltransferase [Aspergillus puulaauensis]|uniref:Delta(24)-sterol C-methyltransferase n=1 Tax=Aspergillus puulaauensis TaxID=1220207 RepID=A0A7R7XHW6_9EURO|nr:delta(24)-sterol C-methyltransferase [Aspergillus puulaauensis]BCS21766.1 delta(24)-sterol C-methyltransferase [Aspergillus puulaauensis]